MHTEVTSDTDQSKQSLSPKFTYQHGEPSELSFCEENASPSGQRIASSYRKMRPASAPRAYVADTNIWREFSLPSYCVPDYRRTPAMYIEQDIINKQRQEIQLLMEELGNRDQELTDLVMSHQKQVKVWECDNEKNRALQAKLTLYEEELKSKEEQWRKAVLELANVNDQREVDVKELKRTQGDMIKLTERIMENSLYIKEMEAQNQKLTNSLRECSSIQQAFQVREQELLSLLKEKDFRLTEKQKEVDNLAEHIRILDSQCRELGERNNNMTEETINWRKRYIQVKEEAERLHDDCRKKEENIQKMTQQLHESLQQAIALQKALFTSCEREKCKEEVMYSLRRQHKRTMQELQNIRELYDRLMRDMSASHLSIKDKESVSEGRRKDDQVCDEDGKRRRGEGRHLEHSQKLHHDGRRKANTNMSFNQMKPSMVHEESFLVKESRDRKTQVREGISCVTSDDDSLGNNTEEEGRNFDLSTNHKKVTERSKVHLVNNTSQGPSSNVTQDGLTNRPECKKVSVTNRHTFVELDHTKVSAASFGARSRNSDTTVTNSPGHSPAGRTQKPNIASLQEVVEDLSPEAADGRRVREKVGVTGQVSCTGHAASLAQADHPQNDGLRNPETPLHGSSSYELKPSRTLTGSTRDDILKKDHEQQHFSTSDEPAAATQSNKKKTVEFDMQEHVITSCGQVESHNMHSESDCLVSQSYDRKDVSGVRSYLVSHNKYLPSKQPCHMISDSFSVAGEENIKNSSVKTCEDLPIDNKSSEREHCLIWYRHLENESSNDNKEGVNSVVNEAEANVTMKSMVVLEHPVKYDCCDQCRGKGQRVCECSRTYRSCESHSKPVALTFNSNLSTSDKSCTCPNEPMCPTSKISFVDIDSHFDHQSSIKESENSQFQDFGKREPNGGLQKFPLMSEFKNQLLHQSNKRIQFLLPAVDSLHNTNQHRKSTCEDLPEDVSAYLARQRCFGRERYYNNNNRSDTHHWAIHTVTEFCHEDQQSDKGQSLPSRNPTLSSSGHLVPSNGQMSTSGQLQPGSGQMSNNGQVPLSSPLTSPSSDKISSSGPLLPNKGQMLSISGQSVQNTDQILSNRGQLLPNRNKTLPICSQLLLSSDQILSSIDHSVPRSGQVLYSCHQSLPSKGQVLSSSDHSVPIRGQVLSSSGLSVPSSGQVLSSSGESVPTSIQILPSSGESVPTSIQILPSSGQAVPSSDQILSNSGQVLSSSGQLMPSNGQVLPSSGQVLSSSVQVVSSSQVFSSNGQSLLCSDQKLTSIDKPNDLVCEHALYSRNKNTHEKVVCNKEELSVFQVMESKRCKELRRGKILEVGRELGNYEKKNLENHGRNDHHDSRSNNAVCRFDDDGKTFDDSKFADGYVRSDDCTKIFDDGAQLCNLGSQRLVDDYMRPTGANKFDDCIKVSDVSGKRFDDTKRSDVDAKTYHVDSKQREGSHARVDGTKRSDFKQRYDVGNELDKSARYRSRKMNLLDGHTLPSDGRSPDAGESSVHKPTGELILVGETHHVQEKTLKVRGQFQTELVSQKILKDVKGSSQESYFCPEESETETDMGTGRKCPLLADGDKKLSLAQMKAPGQQNVRTTVDDLCLQKPVSENPGGVAQAVETDLVDTRGNGSGPQNDTLKTVVSTRHGKLAGRSCGPENRSILNMSSRQGKSDYEAENGPVLTTCFRQRRLEGKSIEWKNRPSITIFANQAESDSKFLEFKTLSNITTSSARKPLGNHFFRQDHRIRETNKNNTKKAPATTSPIVIKQSDSPSSGSCNPCSGTCSQGHMSSDHPSQGHMSSTHPSQCHMSSDHTSRRSSLPCAKQKSHNCSSDVA